MEREKSRRSFLSNRRAVPKLGEGWRRGVVVVNNRPREWSEARVTVGHVEKEADGWISIARRPRTFGRAVIRDLLAFVDLAVATKVRDDGEVATTTIIVAGECYHIQRQL